MRFREYRGFLLTEAHSSTAPGRDQEMLARSRTSDRLAPSTMEGWGVEKRLFDCVRLGSYPARYRTTAHPDLTLFHFEDEVVTIEA